MLTDMGVAPSTMEVRTSRPIVRPPNSPPVLPNFAVNLARFNDNSCGFVVTYVDLAKNSNTQTFIMTEYYKPTENSLVILTKEDAIFTFERDIKKGPFYCRIQTQTSPPIVRPCESNFTTTDEILSGFDFAAN